MPLSTFPVHCPCGSVVDQCGDHLLGCGHVPKLICRHDDLCDVIYYALQSSLGQHWLPQKTVVCWLPFGLGDVFHPGFVYGRPAYFDVAMQESLLGWSAFSAGVAATRGGDKYEQGCRLQGGVIFLLMVDVVNGQSSCLTGHCCKDSHQEWHFSRPCPSSSAGVNLCLSVVPQCLNFLNNCTACCLAILCPTLTPCSVQNNPFWMSLIYKNAS